MADLLLGCPPFFFGCSGMVVLYSHKLSFNKRIRTSGGLPTGKPSASPFNPSKKSGKANRKESGVSHFRNYMRRFLSSIRLTAAVSSIGMLTMTACASHPPMQSMAPGPTADHGFPGVSVSEEPSQFPSAPLPSEDSDHRIYTGTMPPLPATKSPEPPTAQKFPTPPIPTQKTVYFSFNSSRLSYWDMVVLDKLVEELKSCHYKAIMLYGSTDPLGSEVYNKKLGLLRSLSVKRYLVSKGLPALRLKAVSWGAKKSRLFSSCRKKSNLCHSQSRSVRIEVRKRA